ncbi:MAG: sigma-70 family RNA polymerase sigma factor [Planctomycetes bacterium]|nr:sigma-70 family RNA polymerase sigma factor [Planctomycetota bacterium]
MSDDSPAAGPSALAEADRRLVLACLSREPGAWETLVDRFGGLLAHVATRTARQRGHPIGPADRDDLVADILHELLRNDDAALRAFGGRASLTTYLTVIARRTTARRLAAAPPAGRHHGAESHAAAADEAARRADRDHVESLLAGLDDQEARLVRLHHIERRSYGEISQLTGIPLGSIGPALSRARDKMRKRDEPDGDARHARAP